MKEYKKLTVALLAVLLTFGAEYMRGEIIGSACGEHAAWRMNDSHDTLWITGYGAMQDYRYVSASPWNSYHLQVQTIVFSDSITRIGSYCFSDYYALTEIHLPKSLRSVGENAFGSCMAVRSVIWNDSLQTIEYGAFYDIGVDSLVIPASVTSIAESALMVYSNCYIEFQSLNPPSIHSRAFIDNTLLHVPCQALPAYHAATDFPVVASDGYQVSAKPNDSELGSVDLYQYNCDSAILTATPDVMSTFAGWSDGSTANPYVIQLQQDCTLTANFLPNHRYRIVFLNSDSTVLEVDSVLYGEIPVYHGDTPQMPNNPSGDSVQFRKWYPALSPVTEDYTYIAHYHYIAIDTTYLGLCLHADTVSSVGMNNYYWNSRNPQLQYSEDGRIWYDWDYSTLLLSTGDSLFFRGCNPQGVGQYISWLQSEGWSTFVMTGRIRGTGNILSLIDTTMTTRSVPPYGFVALFEDCEVLIEAPDMPVDTIGAYGCKDMYYNTGISRTPALPAMQLNEEAYRNMFSFCRNLTEVTPLPAMEMAEGCYCRMYEMCTSLRVVQDTLPSKELAQSCYWGMYSYCPIEVAPEIMAEGVAKSCCIEMFR